MIPHARERSEEGISWLKLDCLHNVPSPVVMSLKLIPTNSPAILLRLDRRGKRIGAFAKLVLFRDRGKSEGGALRSRGGGGRMETHGGEGRDGERTETLTPEPEMEEGRTGEERSRSERQGAGQWHSG